MDCDSNAAVPSSPGYINRDVIYSGGTKAGWGWQSYKASDQQWVVQGGETVVESVTRLLVDGWLATLLLCLFNLGLKGVMAVLVCVLSSCLTHGHLATPALGVRDHDGQLPLLGKIVRQKDVRHGAGLVCHV